MTIPTEHEEDSVSFQLNVLPMLLLMALPTASSLAQDAAPAMAADPAPAVKRPAKGMHRYMVVRTFPAGALAGLDAAGKKAVNACNSTHGVRWVYSYANPDLTKTFCIYEGPSEQAVRDAAAGNKIPVDAIFEVPKVLAPK